MNKEKDRLPTEYNRYIEPFLGGGSVFFHMSPDVAIVSDVNQELINTYIAVRDNVDEVYRTLNIHARKHSKQYYYRVREMAPRTNHTLAARMIYLNKACFNGIYRVNKAGKFNVPFGTRTELKFEHDNLVESSIALLGSKSVYLFSPDDAKKYKNELNIPEHNDNTIKSDFFNFLEERDYSLSYKMPFMLSFIKHINEIGDARIDDVLSDYIAFYQDRLDRGLKVDRSTCPYNEKMLADRNAICRNMLTNPFEKFERKSFLYYSKDLSIISMNHALFSQMDQSDWERVENQLMEDLRNYYEQMGGLFYD